MKSGLLKQKKRRAAARAAKGKVWQRKAAERQLRRDVGPTSAFAVYSKTALKGAVPGSGAAQAAAAKWRAMTEEEKRPYVAEASANSVKYAELKAAKRKRPVSKRCAFFKEHFAAAFEGAMKTAPNKSAAFVEAVRSVNARWKQGAV
eukprot:TRINITY_DN27135_c0_g1_i2.p2 TRINITY_DN27135_c0_g1~~TRINITY_DN27135_c0_g1_i2.p2  ORF type:complete len:147 (+),score=46.01 TRINITY_DN27135_c0_g1_i2:556-996(+)